MCGLSERLLTVSAFSVRVGALLIAIYDFIICFRIRLTLHEQMRNRKSMSSSRGAAQVKIVEKNSHNYAKLTLCRVLSYNRKNM